MRKVQSIGRLLVDCIGDTPQRDELINEVGPENAVIDYEAYNQTCKDHSLDKNANESITK